MNQLKNKLIKLGYMQCNECTWTKIVKNKDFPIRLFVLGENVENGWVVPLINIDKQSEVNDFVFTFRQMKKDLKILREKNENDEGEK